MRWVFWFVFIVGAVVIVSSMFRLIWSILAIPLMLLGVVFSFLFGILPALLLVILVGGLLWACGTRLPFRLRFGGWSPRWRPPWRRWM